MPYSLPTEAETDRRRATIEAEKVREVSKIRMEQQMTEKESQKKIQEIEDLMSVSRAKAATDAQVYSITKIGPCCFRRRLSLNPNFPS
jgi:erlin